jgi:hypothetical protein
MKHKSLIIAILVGVIAAGAGFFAGMKYQQSRRPTFSRQAGGIQGARTGVGANRMGFRPVSGEIISADDKSITVKLQDGSSKIVLFSDKTEINKADTATKDDLKVGERVAVFGQDNSDGSVTAQNIQLNPIVRANQPPTQ